MSNDKELTIGIRTEYDDGGAQAALADADKLQQTAPARQQAAAQNADALSREQRELEAVIAQMALEAKGRAGLIRELERLGKARAAAAKAGDVQTFRKLEEQMTKTRAAFEKMNQGLEISRLGMMGQMQVAMSAMGAIQSLGNEVQNGSVSLSGMANAVYALGAAIKAGMGPVGWIMMAIQGLSMAWDWYSNKQEKAAQAEKERMEAEQEALQKHWADVQRWAAMDRENNLTSWKKDIEAMGQSYRESQQKAQDAQRLADMQAEASAERRRLAAQSACDAELARVELAKTLGEITEAEAAKRRADAEDAREAELLAIDEAEARRTNTARVQSKHRALAAANELEKALKEKFDGMDNILRVEMPTPEEWEALQIKLNEGIGSMEERMLSRSIHDQISELRSMLEAMGVAWQGTDAELIKWVNSMREAREAGEQRVRELRAEAQEEHAAAMEAKLTNETRRAEAQADAERRAAARKLEETRLRQQNEANRLAEEWQEVQRGSLEERMLSRSIHDQISELRSMLEAMGVAWQGTDAELIKWVNSMREAREAGEQRVRELRAEAQEEHAAAMEAKLTNETRRAEAQADAERRAAARKLEETRLRQQNEANRLAEEWQEVQRGSLEDQAAWLEQTASSFAAGSDEAKKWVDALRAVNLRRITEELNTLGDAYKVTGNYAVKDNRTQAQIFAADEQALRQRRCALERMKAAPDVDAATLKAINAKIKETDRQMRGLRQSMQDAAHAAQKSVAALKPLGQQATRGSMQGALKRAEKAFVQMARNAERQASRGDTKSMGRTLAAMRRNAAQQERLTGYTGRAAGNMREVESKLRTIARGTAAQDRGLTAQQRQQNKVLQSLGMQRRYAARQQKAADKAAKAKEKEAKANERAAKTAAVAAGKVKPVSQTVQIQKLTASLQEANKSLAEQKAEVLRLNNSIQTLTVVAREGAAAATRCASAAASAIAGLKRDVNTLKSAVERLRRK